MTTPAKVQEWLRNNDGNLSDAYKAVGYEGAPLKIKDGNLKDKRSKIRLSQRGENGDFKRNQAINLRQPTSREEQNANRRQNYKRRSLQQQFGLPMVIDHVVDLGLLYDTVKSLSKKDQQKEIQKLEKSYGPLGNRPGNRKIISSKQNSIKNTQTRNVQRRLGYMEQSNPSRSDFGIPVVGSMQGGGYRVQADPLGTGATFMIP